MIDHLPISERPRERCLNQGAHCLSLRECLALILGSGPPKLGSLGLASAILDRHRSLPDEQAQGRAFFLAMESGDGGCLSDLPGLGDANRARLLAAFELARRYAHFRQQGQRQNTKQKRLGRDLPEQALDRIPQALRSDPREWIGFVPVLSPGGLGQFNLVERGVRTHVNLDPAELFGRVLALRPCAFYLFHNHPSGNPDPSTEDIDLTQRVRDVARSLGVRLLGHGVVCATEERWVILP